MLDKCSQEFTQKMSMKCHPKNVHEKSPKKRTLRGQKCPRDVAKSVHEMSSLLSTRCHLLCPRDVCHPICILSTTNPVPFNPNLLRFRIRSSTCHLIFLEIDHLIQQAKEICQTICNLCRGP